MGGGLSRDVAGKFYDGPAALDLFSIVPSLAADNPMSFHLGDVSLTPVNGFHSQPNYFDAFQNRWDRDEGFTPPSALADTLTHTGTNQPTTLRS